MCFSAQASFIASGVLSAIGLYSIRKARQKDQPLALVPLLFAFQQAAEGIIWITYTNPTYGTITRIATYVFCFFAYFVWPIWIPFATVSFESHYFRKKALWILLFLGALISGSLMYYIIQHGIILEISCSHIKYDIMTPYYYDYIGGIGYCLATIAPFFITNKKHIKVLGVLLLASVLISYYAYYTYFTSIWCFFAALLSSFIVSVL